MRSLSELANTIEGGQQNPEPAVFDPSARLLKKATTAFIANAMPVFTIYFADFAHKYGNQDDDTISAIAREYAQQLVKNGVNGEMLMKGLERLKAKSTDLKWTPNPQRFAELCLPQPEDLDVPDLQNAKREVIEARGPNRLKGHEYSCDLVKVLDSRVGYEMYEMPPKLWDKLVEREYKSLFSLAMKGLLPEPMLAIGHDKKPQETDLQKCIQDQGAEVLARESGDPLLQRIKQLGAKQ